MSVVIGIPLHSPNQPIDVARQCCYWCGCVLDEASPSEFFHHGECFQRWHAWYNKEQTAPRERPLRVLSSR